MESFSRSGAQALALLLTIFCGAPVLAQKAADAGTLPPEAVTLKTFRAAGAVLGLSLGQSRTEAAKTLAARQREDVGNEILVWNALSWGGHTAEQTYLLFAPQGGLVGWRTTVVLEGKEAVERIKARSDAVCQPLGRTERSYPMPPTPRPGDPPPPVVTKLRCHTTVGDARLALIEIVTVSRNGNHHARISLSVERERRPKESSSSPPPSRTEPISRSATRSPPTAPNSSFP